MRVLNEDLAFMGSLCDKMKFDLFDIQHRRLSEDNAHELDIIRREMINLSLILHKRYEIIREEDSHQLPEPKEYKPEKPLRTSEEGMIRRRKFDGSDSKTDHFH